MNENQLTAAKLAHNDTVRRTFIPSDVLDEYQPTSAEVNSAFAYLSSCNASLRGNIVCIGDRKNPLFTRIREGIERIDLPDLPLLKSNKKLRNRKAKKSQYCPSLLRTLINKRGVNLAFMASFPTQITIEQDG